MNNIVLPSEYLADTFTLIDKEYLAITKKNVYFIEGILKLDSNYKLDGDINKGPIGKFRGSTAYWFNLMNNGGDYKECLLNAIIAIDVMNSTHLEATINGREKMRDIIFNKCPTLKDLKNNLKKGYKNKDCVLYSMSVELESHRANGTRVTFSFATKFCSYAALYLGLGDFYPRYDSVVSKVLTIYIEKYLNENLHKTTFAIDYLKRDADPDYYYHLYVMYFEYLDQLCGFIPGFGFNELDHVIWYGNKGM